MGNEREKTDPLPVPVTGAVEERRPPSRKSKWRVLAFISLLAIAMTLRYTGYGGASMSKIQPGHYDANVCPQSNALYPNRYAQLWESLGNEYDQDEFNERATEWLQGAVRIPTEIYDEMGPIGEDERWEIFEEFHDYLAQAFPLINETLTLTKVNTYGLLYEWKGSDDSLKPLLLTAHQDVVPANPETFDQWTHPPYDGYFDGEFIWGRGSMDNKGGLIGILSSIETLLKKDFEPTRTVVLAFGFDEEVGGLRGAQNISKVIVEKYGKNSMALLVDEGGLFAEIGGSVIFLVGTAEKGLLDTKLTVMTPGGHSSVPPPHTGIGILSRLLVEYEDNPFEARLERNTPVYNTVQCVGKYIQNIPSALRDLIEASAYSDTALYQLQAVLIKDTALRALIGTTQAINLFRGGVKANAMPEEAWAVVNHRIATQSSVAAVKQRDTDVLKDLAKEFNLTYTAFGSPISPEDEPTEGTLTLIDAWGTALEPAPVTPTDGDPVWELFSGTIKATYNAQRGLEGDNIVVSPGILTGNTDSKHYWDLTPHIFRYSHFDLGTAHGVHTINECIKVETFVEMIRFYTALILNVDESSRIA